MTSISFPNPRGVNPPQDDERKSDNTASSNSVASSSKPVDLWKGLVKESSSPRDEKMMNQFLAYLFLDEEIGNYSFRRNDISFCPVLTEALLPKVKELAIISSDLDAISFSLKGYFSHLKEIIDFNKSMQGVRLRLSNLQKKDKDSVDRFVESQGEKIRQEIEGLKAGKSILLPGGCINNGCDHHAMAYEITRNPNNSFKIIVINTNRTNSVKDVEVTGRKIKIAPYLVFSSVSENQMFPGGSNFFIESLLFPLLSYRGRKELQVEDIYTTLLLHLSPTSEDPLSKRVITEQRSNTSPWKVLLAFMRMKLPEQDYKRLHFYIRMLSLESVFNDKKGKSSWTEEERVMMRNASRKLHIEADKKFGTFLSSTDVEKTSSFTSKIRDRIQAERAAQLQKGRERQLTAPYFFNPRAFQINPESESSLQHLLRSLSFSKSETIPGKQALLRTLPEDFSQKSLIEQLTSLNELLENADEPSFLYLQTTVDRFVHKLSLDSSFTGTIVQEDLPEVIQKLSQLLRLYRHITIEIKKISNPTLVNTTLALYILIFELTKKEKPELLQGYSLYNPLHSIYKDPAFLPAENEQLKRFFEIANYFELNTKGVPLFTPFEWTRLDQKTAEQSFYTKIIQQNAPLQWELTEELARQVTEYFSHDREAQNLYVYDQKTIDLWRPIILACDPSLLRSFSELSSELALIESIYITSSFVNKDILLQTEITPHFTLKRPVYFPPDQSDLVWAAGGEKVTFFDKPSSLFRSLFPVYQENGDQEFQIDPRRLDDDNNLIPFREDQRSLGGLEPEVDPLRIYWRERKVDSLSYIFAELSSAKGEISVRLVELLDRVMPNISFFADPDLQTIFWQQFFQIIVKKNTQGTSFHFDLPEQFEGNPQLVNSFITFIYKGLFQFFDSPEKRDFSAGCFFIRMAVRASEIILTSPDINNKRFLQLLNTIQNSYLNMLLPWIKEESSFDFDEVNIQRALAHLHKLYFHLTVMPLLGKSVDLFAVIPAFFAYKQIRIEKANSLSYLEDLVDKKYYALLQEIEPENIDLDQLIVQVFSETGLQIPDLQYPTKLQKGLQLSKGNKELTYEANLATGKLKINRENLYPARTYPFSHKNNRFLFGNFLRVVQESASNFYFTAEHFGAVSVKNKDLDHGIQVELEDKGHCQFIPPEQIQNKSMGHFPNALIGPEYLHWLAEMNNGENVIYVTKKCAPTKVVYQLLADGRVQDVKSGKFLTRAYDNSSKNLTIFELPEEELIVVDREECPVQIKLPRYQSLDGTPLFFHQTEGCWYWSGSDYKLLTDSTKYFGEFTDYLTIQHRTGEQKILIPMAPFSTDSFNPFSTKAELVRAPQEKDLRSEKQTFYYFTFSIKNVELNGKTIKTVVADNAEGHLFLAYIYLRTGRYHEALHELEQFSDADNYSSIAKESFHLLAFYCNNHNYQPNAVAISLRAITRAIYQSEKISLELRDKGYFTELETLYRKYTDRLHSISPELLLSSEEEIDIIKTLKVHVHSGIEFWKEREKYLLGEDSLLTRPFIESERKLLSSVSNLRYDTAVVQRLKVSPPKEQIFYSSLLRKVFEGGSASLVYQASLDWMKTEEEAAQLPFLVKLYIAYSNGLDKKLASMTYHLLPHSHIVRNFHKWTDDQVQRELGRFQGLGGLSPRSLLSPHPIPTRKQEEQSKVLVTAPDIQLFQSPLHNWWSQKEQDHPPSNISKKVEKEQELLSDTPIMFQSKNYTRVRGREIAEVLQEINIGAKRLPTQQHIDYQRAKQWKDEIKLLLTENQTKIKGAQKSLLQQANPEPVTEKERLLVLSEKRKAVTLEGLEMLYLQRDENSYRRTISSFLSTEEITHLHSEIAKWELLEIEKIRLNRAERLLTQLENPNLQESVRKNLSFQFFSLVKSGLEHLAIPYPQPLVFTRRTGLILREDQMQDLKHLLPNEPNCFFGKFMGGGKTSAIAPNAAAMARGLAIFITDSSQTVTVANILKRTQYTAFGQKVFTLHYTRDQLTVPRLEKILERLELGVREKELLITEKSFIQILDLERTISNFEYHLPSEELEMKDRSQLGKKIQLLNQILDIFLNKSVGIGDEVDSLLRTNLLLHFPFGRKQKLPSYQVTLVKKLFLILTTEESIKDRINLEKGKQTLLREKDWDELAPILAEKCFALSEINIEDRYKDSFIRFTTKGFDPSHTQSSVDRSSDKEFFDFLKFLYESNSKRDTQKANSICLIRNLLQDILPFAFQQSVGRNFGRAIEGDRVVPYSAAKTPEPTHFGHPIEALVKQLMTALVEGITKERLQTFAAGLIESANPICAKKGIPLDLSTEGKFFQKVSGGLTFKEIGNEEKLKTAIAHMNQSVALRLSIEAEIAHRLITEHKEVISSTSHDFTHSLGSFHGMSGTLWNSDGFPITFSEGFPDEGELGKIYHTILERSDETEVFVGNPDELSSMLKTIFKRKTFHALLDPGALLKNHGNSEVAKALFQYINENNLPFKSIIFFDKRPGEVKTNHLFALTYKNNRYKRIYLEGADANSLKKKEIDPQTAFFFVDEPHSTGFDPYLPDGAEALVTVDEKMQSRTLLQTVMRMRKFLTNQRVDFFISEDLKKIMGDKDPLLFLLQMVISNQAEMRANSLLRSYKQMLLQVIKNQYRTHLATLPPLDEMSENQKEAERLRHMVYRQFFFEKTFSDLPLLYLSKETTVSTPDKLQYMAENLKTRFKRSINSHKRSFPDQTLTQSNLLNDERAISEGLDTIVERAKQHHDLFPDSSIQREYESIERQRESAESIDSRNPLGLQMQVEMEKQQEIEHKKEKAINLSIDEQQERELRQYQCFGNVDYRQESNWNEQEILTFLQQLKTNSPTKQRLISLSKLFLEFTGGEEDDDDDKEIVTKYHRFAEIFPKDTIYTTDNFRLQENRPLPVFDQTQRSANQILIVETDQKEFQFILLSEKEAGLFEEVLKKQYSNEKQKNVWLVSSSAIPFATNPKDLPLDDFRIRQNLVIINLFSGNFSSILALDLEKTARRWVHTNLNSTLANIKANYLELRFFDHPIDNRIMREHHLLDPLEKVQTIEQYTSLVRDQFINIIEISDAEKQKLQSLTDKNQLDLLEPYLMQWLNPAMVPYLTDEEQIRMLSTREQIQLVPVEMIDCLADDQIEMITAEQAFHLNSFENISRLLSTTLDQMIKRDLSEEQKEKLQYISKRLSAPQIKGLTDVEWIKLIPFSQLPYLQKDLLKKVISLVGDVLPDNDLNDLPDPAYLEMDPSFWERITSARLKKIVHKDLLNSLEGKYLNKISPKVVDKLTDKKLQELTSPSLINSVPPERWVHLSIHQLHQLEESRIHGIGFEKKDINLLVSLLDISPELIAKFHHEHLPLVIDAIKEKKPDNDKEIFQAITSAQLEKYPKEHIDILPVETFSKLPEERLGDLTEDQLNYIKDSTLLNKLPTKQIHLLNRDQISSLNNEKFKEISYDQIEALEKKEDIQRLDADQVKHTRSDQFIHLTKSQVKELSDSQVKLIDEPTCIQHLSDDQIKALSTHQFIHLTDEQLKKLTLSQIQAIDNKDLINRLDTDQVKLLQQDQLLLLDEDRLQDLSPTQLQSITNPDLLQKLKKDEVKKLLPTQFEDLTDEQLKDLTIDQLQQIENRKVAQRLPQESIRHLEPGQVQYLEDTQIEYFSVEKIDRLAREILPTILPHMTDEQKENLSEEQIQSLEGEESISHLVGANISHLKNRQLVHLTADLMPHASCSQKMIRIFLLCFLPLFNLIAALFHWLTCGTLRSSRSEREPISA